MFVGGAESAEGDVEAADGEAEAVEGNTPGGGITAVKGDVPLVVNLPEREPVDSRGRKSESGQT